MRGKITKRSVDALTPTDTPEVVLWDTEIKGFGVRARTGGTKTYILHYRPGGGRSSSLRKFSIGRHGSPWTPNTARIEAKRLLGRVAAGEDPGERKSADRRAMTVAELCDLYLAEGAIHKKASTPASRSRSNSPSHQAAPYSKRAEKLTRADVERMMIDVKTGKAISPHDPNMKRPSGSIPTGGAEPQRNAWLSSLRYCRLPWHAAFGRTTQRTE